MELSDLYHRHLSIALEVMLSRVFTAMELHERGIKRKAHGGGGGGGGEED